MRNAFASAVISEASGADHFFLTGDLGFMALENIRDVMQERFVNCGVSEQNMISVAAGLAREKFRVFAYSIAPFCYARPFEQIRNDICLTQLPVCVVGNGGGYAYGHMGPTHHALEDCAVMAAIGMRVLVPAFDEDLAVILRDRWTGPTYLRLGYDVRPKDTTAPAYAPWRLVLSGKRGVVVALGPLAGLAWSAFASLDEKKRPAVWAVTELPLTPIPDALCHSISEGDDLIVLEEHVAQGGVGMHLLYELVQRGFSPHRFVHHHAQGYPSGRYGSQNFHRTECGLDEQTIRNIFI